MSYMTFCTSSHRNTGYSSCCTNVYTLILSEPEKVLWINWMNWILQIKASPIILIPWSSFKARAFVTPLIFPHLGALYNEVFD
jgi:hypothetical protein